MEFLIFLNFCNHFKGEVCCPVNIEEPVPTTEQPITSTTKKLTNRRPNWDVPGAPPTIPNITDYNKIKNHPNVNLINRRSCGIYSDNRIINGQAANLKEFPWFALLGFETVFHDLSWNCGGSLISGKRVTYISSLFDTIDQCLFRSLRTSAAHCFGRTRNL